MTPMLRLVFASVPLALLAAPSSAQGDVLLDESFNAADVEALAPSWQSAWLGQAAPTAFAIQDGALVLEAAPDSPALAFASNVLPTEEISYGGEQIVRAAPFEAELVVTAWSGTEPVFGFSLGSSRTVMVSPGGEMALSGCDAESCWDAAYASGLFSSKDGPLRLTLRHVPVDRFVSHLSLLVDGQPALEMWTRSLEENAVGVFAGSETRIVVDRVTVRPLGDAGELTPPEPFQDYNSTWVREDGPDLRRLSFTGQRNVTENRMGHREDVWWEPRDTRYGELTVLRFPAGRLAACIQNPGDGTTRCLDHAAEEPAGPTDVQVCEDLWMDYDCLSYRKNGSGETLRGDGEVWLRAERD